MNQVATRTAGQRFVAHALSIGALELVPEGRKLKSGRLSPYFFNSGLFNSGESLSRLSKAYAAAIVGNFGPDIIFGPAYKGIPLATAIALTLYNDLDISVEVAFNRKEAKDHGEGGMIIGAASLKEKKVLIADDVMTTGTSSCEAVKIIEEYGGTPIGCVIAFDRQERGKESRLSAVQEFESITGIPVCSAAVLDDLVVVLGQKDDDFSAEMAERILEYREQYGVA